MKFSFHLSKKNVCNMVTGVSVIVLAYIPLGVPADHWGWMRWKLAVLVFGLAAVVALISQALIQSREDAELEQKENIRHKAMADLQRSLTPTVSIPLSSPAPSNAITRAVPHSAGSFDSVAFFRNSLP